MAKYEYTLGALGERLKVEETEGDSSRTVEYEYDDVYRLVSETVTTEDKVSVITYTYDKNSNRLTKNSDGEVTEYVYNALNQLISETGIEYSYDLNGNLIEKKALAETTTYTYNKRNRLIRVTAQNGADVNVEEYLYDYAGNRTTKIQEFKTTYYLVDTNGALSQVLAEYDENGSLTTLYTRGSELISQERNGEKSYYLYDGFDSVRMLADDEGVITDTYTYDAFGNLISSTGNTVNDFLYRGEQYDSFTGLYYLRARYMNPSTGSFITMDEYAGSIFEPVSLHKYLYANANPVMYSDPSGYASEAANNFSLKSLISSMGINAIIAEAYTIMSTAARALGAKILSGLVSSTLIFAYVSPFAAFIANDPAFVELCSQIASGEISPSYLMDRAVQLCSEINQKVQEWICKASNRNSSSNGNSSQSSGGGTSPGDPNNWNWRDKLLNQAQNSKLKSIINELYRPGATVGDGGTADMLRQEFASGEPLRHLQKAQERIIQLNNLLNDPTLCESDRKLIYQLLGDLYNAVKTVTQ